MKLKHFSYGVGQNAFHFGWKLKYPKDAFRFDILREDCEIILYQIATKHECTVKELRVMPDHVHLFIFSEFPSTMSPAKALQFSKGTLAHHLFTKHPWLRRYFTKGHLWSAGKFLRSVGNVAAETTDHHIAEKQNGWI